MKVHLAYGRSGLDVELPDDAIVLRPERLPALPKPQEAIGQALRRPIGSRPLRELLQPEDTVAIVFSDITRPIPNHLILPPILAELAAVGVPRENITLINGGGMHRPNTRDELLLMVGPEIVNNYRIVQHDASDRSQLAFLFKDQRGTEVWINSHYMRASVRILTGFVEPHIFAGYSGGGKAVLPGIAGADIVMANHSGPMLSHPQATWCLAEGNPVFQEMRQVALATSPSFIVNVTLNEVKEITAVFAGELVQAHDAGIAFAQRAYLRPVPHEFDIVVTTNIGYPADINLYQAVKGMSVAAQAVRAGGSIILAAECADGLGLPHFSELLTSRDSPRALLEMIAEPGFRAFDQWGVQCLAMVQAKADVYIHSTLRPEDVRRAHLQPCPDVAATVATLSEAHRQRHGGRRPRILVLPYGHLTVPRVTND